MLSGTLFMPVQTEAGFLSSLFGIGDQVYADADTNIVKPPQPGSNSQNPELSLQANVSILQDKNNTDDTGLNIDNISDYALFSQSNGRDTSDFSLVEMIVYPVESGDTLSEIAEKFNTSVNTIRWENNISSQKISVGQKLNIFPDFVGVRHIVKSGDTISKIADKYDAIAEDISIFNDISNGDVLKKDTIVFVPNGIIKPVVSKSTPSSGSSYAISSNTKIQSGYYMRPALGIITSPYGSRKGGFHPGVDIGGSRGTLVVAAASGIVVNVVNGCVEGRKSCGGGYGNHIDIEHPNGDRTKYAHLSKTSVSVGQSVSQGQPIGVLGNTGNSTGPHLHWEVENSNGSKMRPPV